MLIVDQKSTTLGQYHFSVLNMLSLSILPRITSKILTSLASKHRWGQELSMWMVLKREEMGWGHEVFRVHGWCFA